MKIRLRWIKRKTILAMVSELSYIEAVTKNNPDIMSKKSNTLALTLHAMFTENTGRHLLDSGSAYGRAWERNANKTVADFMSAPLETTTVYQQSDGTLEYTRTLDMFQHMYETLSLDRICSHFNKLNTNAGNWDHSYGVSDIAGKYLDRKMNELGLVNMFRENTYNHDTDLNGTLLYTMIGEDPDNFYSAEYVLIQVHGGCDVRGGYTDAKLFKLPEYDDGQFVTNMYQCDNLKEDALNGYHGDTFVDEYDSDVIYTLDELREIEGWETE
jgi:hypothetical protein